MKATVKDLRIHSKGLLDAVSKGEDVVITFEVNLAPGLYLMSKPTNRLIGTTRMIYSEYGRIVPILNQ